MKARAFSTFAGLAMTITARGFWLVTSPAGAETAVAQQAPGGVAIEAAVYSHPQRRVAVDGARRLNVFCLGHGNPTVILDAGRGGSTLDWRSVQGRIAASTRTCSYDRAGYGFSDPSARPADARDAVDDLHRLVAAAKLGRPVILVGHSNGGLYASLYGETYPADTGGMVLVDPGFPGQQNYDAYGLSRAKAAELKAWTTSLVSKAAKCVRLAKAGALTTKHAGDNGCLDDPPNPDLAIHRTLDQQYASVAYQEANLSEFESSFAAIGGTTADDREMSLSPHALGAIPLIVLTASRHAAPISDFTPEDQAMFYSVWKHAHVRVAALSTAGRNVVVGGTGHFIQTDQPAAVVRAVEQVVDTVRHAQGAITPHY